MLFEFNIQNIIAGFILFILTLLFFISFFKDFIKKHKCILAKSRGNWKDIFNNICTAEFMVSTGIVLITLLIFRVQSRLWLMEWIEGLGAVNQAISLFIVSILLCHPLSYMANILHKAVGCYVLPFLVRKGSTVKIKISLGKEDFYLFNTNVVNNVNLLRIFIIFIFIFVIWDPLYFLLALVRYYGPPPIRLDSPEPSDIPSNAELNAEPNAEPNAEIPRVDPTYTVKYVTENLPRYGILRDFWLERVRIFSASFFRMTPMTNQHYRDYSLFDDTIIENINNPEMENNRTSLSRTFHQRAVKYWEPYVKIINENNLNGGEPPKMHSSFRGSSIVFIIPNLNILVILSDGGGIDNNAPHIADIRRVINDNTSHRWNHECLQFRCHRVVHINAKDLIRRAR